MRRTEQIYERGGVGTIGFLLSGLRLKVECDQVHMAGSDLDFTMQAPVARGGTAPA